jgi:hypothetical protein
VALLGVDHATLAGLALSAPAGSAPGTEVLEDDPVARIRERYAEVRELTARLGCG